MYHIVEFRADGGQMCVPGLRSFTDPILAEKFAERHRNQVGHSCGSQSVKAYTSETDMGNYGYELPDDPNAEYRGFYQCQLRLNLGARANKESFWATIKRLLDPLFS